MLFNHHRPTTVGMVRARGEHGYVMVMFALLLVPLLLMAGLAVDVGHWYSRTSDMRRAADAAALAGVVWLPDEAAARTAALAAAARNGFVPSSTISITVTASTQSERRLKVVIRDRKVGSFFYTSLGGSKLDLSRTSFAEYVLAVPMGSPRNFFGTGTLLNTYTATGITPEWLYQSVNPYCTDKVNGDRYQSGFFNAPTTRINNVGYTTCATNANTEYRTSGYSMYIEAPVGRQAPIDVKLYDARYSEAAVTWQVRGQDDCVTTTDYVYPTTPVWTTGTGTSNVTWNAPVRYQTRTSDTGTNWSPASPGTAISTGSFTNRGVRTRVEYPNVVNWTPASATPSAWTIGSGSGNITINGPAMYQTRTSSSSNTWSPSATTWITLNAGQSVTRRANLTRYRTGTYQTSSNTVCTPTYTTYTDPVVDDYRQSGTDNYTYTLYAADNTPLNDEDNPQICQQTYTPTSAPDGTEYLGSRRWNTLCTIGTGQPSGRYILKVTNSGLKNGSAPNLNDGSNQWGLVAKYQTTGDGLCDGRTDTMCPRVYGKDAISVRAASTATVASFYLAEIEPEHAGKKLKLELFDPGEGGNTIEIMRPSGTNGNTWTPATFSWKANNTVGGATSGTNVTSLSLRYSCTTEQDGWCDKFNGKLVEITIDLAGYSPPTNNDWWQIRYTFATGAAVTDRTTWSARIIGDPVHLVEEY